MAWAIIAMARFNPNVRAADTSESILRLTVELRDGSRVVGQGVEEKMKFHSALLGNLKLAFGDIRSVEFTATNLAKLTAANGDVLTVQPLEKEIPIRTSFGRVELAVDSIRSLRISQAISLEKLFADHGSKTKPPHHIAYIVPAGTVGNQQLKPEQAQTLGSDFDINTPVKITALGVFDSGGDGLLGKMHVRIYDRNSRVSLADIEFTPENPGTLAGGSRFLPLKDSPVLKQGFQGIISVAYLGEPACEPDGNARINAGGWTVDGDDGAISFVGTSRHSYAGTGDSFPDVEDPSRMPNNFAAGTFIFSRMPSK